MCQKLGSGYDSKDEVISIHGPGSPAVPYRAENFVCCWHAASILIETNQSHPASLLTLSDLSCLIKLFYIYVCYILFSFR